MMPAETNKAYQYCWHGGGRVDSNLLLQGLELMLLGMGIVFGFLTVLVFTLRGMSLLAIRLHVDQPTLPAQPAVAVAAPDQRQLVAVITAAVDRYRATRAG